MSELWYRLKKAWQAFKLSHKEAAFLAARSRIIHSLSGKHGFDPDATYKELTPAQKKAVNVATEGMLQDLRAAATAGVQQEAQSLTPYVRNGVKDGVALAIKEQLLGSMEPSFAPVVSQLIAAQVEEMCNAGLVRNVVEAEVRRRLQERAPSLLITNELVTQKLIDKGMDHV